MSVEKQQLAIDNDSVEKIGSKESAILEEHEEIGRRGRVVKSIPGTKKRREGESVSGQPTIDNTPHPVDTCPPYSDLAKKEEGGQMSAIRKETAERLG